MKRLKWEPAALMVLVLGLGLWIAFGPGSKPKIATRPNAVLQEVRVGNDRGYLEIATDPGAADPTCRLLFRDHAPARAMSIAQASDLFGPELVQKVIAQRDNRVFSWLKITSWAGVVWLGIGLIGQIAFSGRMILQWIVSEKRRESVITESFWWFSLFGSVTLFCYFVWRQEPIGMLGQASGVVIYARNLRLIYKHKRRAARARTAVEIKPASASAAPSPEASTVAAP